MARRKILISGYYGYGNAGDEAILAAILQALSREVPDADVCVLSGNPERTRDTFGVRAVPGKNIVAILKEIWASSLVVSGGGGLIQDSTGIQTIIYYLSIVSMARKLRRPVMFYAQGVGPVSTSQGRSLTRRVASRVQLITVRDEESKALFQEMGVKGPPIIVTADPVLALEPAPASTIDEIAGAEAIPKAPAKVVAFSLRPWPDSPQAAEAFVAAGRALVADGCKVVVMPFQESQDRRICNEVTEAIGEGAQVLGREYGPTELMGLIGRMDAVVGMRLHALIFGGAQAIPIAGVAYDPKVANFLRRTQAPSIALVGLTPDPLVAAARDLVKNGPHHAERLRRLVPPMREQALETSRLLRRLLDGRGRLREAEAMAR
jgi:polysaccharide pyruvyl transferase CsaB